MDHSRALISAELKFRQILEDYFISVYDEKSLPSHGIYHHRRVWNYIKELLSNDVFRNKIHQKNFHENLIIAAYLHDIGMSVEKGVRHGRISRNFCEEFFSINKLNRDSFAGVLDAIEHHDAKDYREKSVNDLLSILSVADDLDAYGYTGIYRYAEIYFERGMSPADVGPRIKENARKRFENFTDLVIPSYVVKHRKRYEILDNFMTAVIIESENYRFGIEEPHGHCGVMDLLFQLFINKTDINEFTATNHQNDQVISSFFTELENERKATLIT